MKRAVQFGSGGIGRGFLGQLLSESGYEIVFVDIDRNLVDSLNHRGSYPLQLVGDRNEILTITNIRAVLAEQKDAVAQEIAQADFICTASGVQALPAISEVLALGLQERRKNGADPVNIVICENLNRAAEYLRDLLVQQSTCPPGDYLDEYVGLVQSVVARMAPVRTPDMMAKDPLLIVAESYPFLPVDAAAIRGRIPDIKGIIPADNFQAYVNRKLYVHNAMHAICGYLGYAKGHEYVWQAVADPQIRQVVESAMADVCEGLSKTHNLDPVGLAENVYDLLRRFSCQALGDTVARVAGDPIRKLSGPGGRLIGSALLCLSQGIVPEGIVHSIALALRYDHPADESAVKLQAMISDQGIDSVLQQVCKLTPDQQLYRLIRAEYEKTTGHTVK
ncbi:MAG: hypothetical protein GWP14_04940 [Actinobacteria bacterium]|nr:hypothetical protein [Actinomycetota bacterium]